MLNELYDERAEAGVAELSVGLSVLTEALTDSFFDEPLSELLKRKDFQGEVGVGIVHGAVSFRVSHKSILQVPPAAAYVSAMWIVPAFVQRSRILSFSSTSMLSAPRILISYLSSPCLPPDRPRLTTE